MHKLAMRQLVESVRVFVQHSTGAKVTSRQGGKMTHFVDIPSTSEIDLCVDVKNSGKPFGMS